MNDLWIQVKDWILSLGEKYGVDPIIFGIIYVGAIPFFMASVAWLVRNYRRKSPVTLPALSAGFWFISAYLYLFIAGENIPLWVYALVVILITYGAYSSIKAIKGKIAAAPPSQDTLPPT